MSFPDLTIIVITRNTNKISRECLRKVLVAKNFCERQLKNRVVIVVVDNASTDGTLHMLKKHFPWVMLIKSRKNLGFGRANNLAMQKAKTPLILLLNSDAFLKKDTLTKALSYMGAHSECSALCVRLTFPNLEFQPCGGYLPTPLRTMLWSFGFENLPLIKNLIRPIYIYDRKFYQSDRLLEWASGAFFLIKQEIFEKTQGFDEKLFMYFEDIEWSKRIKDLGFKILFTPKISLVHVVGASSNKLSLQAILGQQIKGLLYFHKKHYPKSFPLIAKVATIGFNLRSIFYLLRGGKDTFWAYNRALAKNRAENILD